MSQIPKILHYCWFGSSALPDLAVRCMQSWKECMPDYEIMVWNEQNSDFQECRYATEAHEAKKWAFLSDYVRLKVLHEHGGIYLDTDVEVLKSFTPLLVHRAFIGFERATALSTAVIGAEKRSKWIEMLIKNYQDKRFIDHHGTHDYTTNVFTVTKLTLEHLALKLDNCRQSLDGQLEIFPTVFFSPIDFETGAMCRNESTYAIHHFAGSWLGEYTHRRFLRQRRLTRVLGRSLGLFINKLLVNIEWRISCLLGK